MTGIGRGGTPPGIAEIGKTRALTTKGTKEHKGNPNSRGRLFHTRVDGDKLSVSPQGCTSKSTPNWDDWDEMG